MSSNRDLIKKVHQRPVDVIIGKRGLTDAVLKEIESRLKVKGYVKVKILKTGLEVSDFGRRELAKEVSRQLGVKLAGVRGRTFVLYREHIKENRSFTGEWRLRAKRSRLSSLSLGGEFKNAHST